MRLPPLVISSAEEVLREILRFTAPADSTLSRYFREHPRLGGRERGMIAESIYAVLRNKLVYTNFAESGVGSAMRRLALLGLADVAGLDALSGVTPEETAWLERVLGVNRELLPPNLKANLPDWLYQKLLQELGEDGLLQMARVLNSPAPLDLRVNVKAKAAMPARNNVRIAISLLNASIKAVIACAC